MRAIDADAFKDYIRGACEDMKHLFKDNADFAKLITESFCKDIDEQPTIQPEPHWIPCSERLPEVKQKVLVQYPDGSMATKRCNDAGHLAWFYSNAVAWMSAPELYKGATDGRD